MFLYIVSILLFITFIFWDSLENTSGLSRDTVIICAYITYVGAKIVSAIKGKYDRIP